MLYQVFHAHGFDCAEPSAFGGEEKISGETNSILVNTFSISGDIDLICTTM